MNSIFSEKRPLCEPMQQALIALQNNEAASIVLAVADDPFAPPDNPCLLRDEIKGELAERLFGKYTFYEFNFATAEQASLPRYCRALRERPACVLAYGLETLSAHDHTRYREALQLLNNHREDIRDTQTALVLLMSPAVQKDVLEYAPDFADWRKASVHFKVPSGEDVPSTVVGRMPVAEADYERRQIERFANALESPEIEAALAAEFCMQLAQAYDRLGQTEESHYVAVRAAEIRAELSSVAQTERVYLKYLLEHCGNLDPKGIPQTARAVTLPLDEVYVSLTAERETERAEPIEARKDKYGLEITDFDEMREAAYEHIERLTGKTRDTPQKQIVSVPVELPNAIRDSAKAVILGDPGAGKTTLLKFLAARFAKALQDNAPTATDKEGNDYGEPRLPVLLRVSEYAKVIGSANPPALREFLACAFDNAPLTRKELADLFEDALQKGRAIILLDGLDEVAKTSERVEIARQIDALASRFEAGNRIVVTSRVAGYREARLNNAFAQYTLRDMERAQIEQFLSRWCVAVERFRTPNVGETTLQAQGKAECDAILREIDGNEGVRRLAKNPLLLTILALIHRNGARLPKRRIELYELATKTLLREWRLEQARSEARVVEEYEALELLGPLALWMHEKEPTGLIAEEKAREKLCDYLAYARGREPEDAEIRAGVEDFLRRVREHTGLFVERAPGRYGFMHLTFEEYFAARELVSDSRKAAKRIALYRHKPRWEEPIRLAIAFERPKDATYLLRVAILAEGPDAARERIKPSEYEEFLRRDLLLAARCIGDCDGIEPRLAHDIAGRLAAIALYQDATAKYEPLRKRVLATLPTLADGDAGAESERLLLAALKDEDRSVRYYAAQALKQLGGATPQVLAALVQALNDESSDVRYSAAAALKQLGAATPQVLAALVQALNDEDSDVRYSAAAALKQLGAATPQVLAALVQALNDESSDVRYSAAAALKQLGAATPQVLAALVQALKDEDSDVRSSAAAALGQLGAATPQVLAALVQALNDENSAVRVYAAAALKQLGGATPQVLAALVQALNDENSDVRRYAAQALGQLGAATPQVLAALVQALNDENSAVRVYAAQALKQLGGATPQVLAALVLVLKDEDRSVRYSAAQALGQLGAATPQVLAALVQALKDEDRSVRDAAWEALWNLVDLTPRPPQRA